MCDQIFFPPAPTPKVLVLVSSLKLRKERRTKQARGWPAVRPRRVHMSTQVKPDRVDRLFFARSSSARVPPTMCALLPARTRAAPEPPEFRPNSAHPKPRVLFDRRQLAAMSPTRCRRRVARWAGPREPREEVLVSPAGRA